MERAKQKEMEEAKKKILASLRVSYESMLVALEKKQPNMNLSELCPNVRIAVARSWIKEFEGNHSMWVEVWLPEAVWADVVSYTKSAGDPLHGSPGQPKIDASPKHIASAIRSVSMVDNIGAIASYLEGLEVDAVERDGTMASIIVAHSLIMCCISGEYVASDRVAIKRICSAFQIPLTLLLMYEDALAAILLEQVKVLLHPDKKETERKSASSQRALKIGLGAVGGGLLIGTLGILAAPVVLPALLVLGGVAATAIAGAGAVSLASALSVSLGLLTVQGVPLIGGLFAVGGAGLVGKKMNVRTAGLSQFEFVNMKDGTEPLEPALHTWISIPPASVTREGLLEMAGDLKPHIPFGLYYTLLFDTDLQRKTCTAVQKLLLNQACTQIGKAALGMTAVGMALVGVMAAAAIPLTATEVFRLIDNEWTLLMDRAKKAGYLLADLLMERAQGMQPVSLCGVGVGARVVWFACMRLGEKHSGPPLLCDVMMAGAPVEVTSKTTQLVRKAIAGKWVNGYMNRDWVLAYLFRLLQASATVGGLVPIEGADVLNVDLSPSIDGHLDYAMKMEEVGNVLFEIIHRAPAAVQDDASEPTIDPVAMDGTECK